MKKKIAVLGATGSIGRQTLDIIRQHPDKLELAAASCGHQETLLKELIQDFPTVQAVSMESSQESWNVPVVQGENHMSRLLEEADFDILVNAAVGFRGLRPTLKAIELGKDVALANKESLVTGGDLVREALKHSPSKLYPIDSEHSAIAQCLSGRKEDVARLIITASGGSLRDKKREELTDITPSQALAHPNWKMGSRITIDSATMVNKGFEVIEAHYLFDVPFEDIVTVLHPQSIVHSMVEYKDHAVIAQLGSADMHLPIQYALMGPERPPLQEAHPLDMSQSLDLHFRKMDFERYPILKTAYQVGRQGGNRGAVFNGADEEAVKQFLEGNLAFLDIERAILYALDSVPPIKNPTLEQLEASDAAARAAVRTGMKQSFERE
jgi:1-deoxy-D-xylulose-5-phosphate reductoisomerase